MPQDRDLDWYYVKKGRRYHKIKPFDGFPSNGVWIVHKDGGISTQTNIMKIGELAHPMPLANMMQHENEACEALRKLRPEASSREVVETVCKAICKAAESKDIEQ